MLNAPTTAETPDLSPEAPRAAPVRHCAFCGEVLIVAAKGPGQHKRFCDSACRTSFANREKAQGAVLVTVAKVWRKARGAGPIGKKAFAEMTAILDLLLDDDRKLVGADGKSLADRLPAYVERLLGGQDDYRGTYLDRRVPRR